MSFTKVNKPTTSSYVKVTPLGRETFDDPNVTYDSPTVFYDGVNQSAWTKLSKPATSNWTKISKPT